MSRAPRGTSTAIVEIRGAEGIHKMLAPLLEPDLTANIDKATKKAAQALAKDVRAEARPVSRRMAKAVRVKRAKTGKPGWVVGSRRKVAFFWHMVIGGTKDHGPRRAPALVFIPGWSPYGGASSKGVGNKVVRTKRVRGVPPNPIIRRVVDRRGSAVLSQLDDDVAKATGLV